MSLVENMVYRLMAMYSFPTIDVKQDSYHFFPHIIMIRGGKMDGYRLDR